MASFTEAGETLPPQQGEPGVVAASGPDGPLWHTGTSQPASTATDIEQPPHVAAPALLASSATADGRPVAGGGAQIAPLSAAPPPAGRYEGLGLLPDGQHHRSSSDRRLRGTDHRSSLQAGVVVGHGPQGTPPASSLRDRAGDRSGRHSALVLETNLRFLRRLALAWVLFFSLYVVLVVAALLLALDNSHSHITLLLLFSSLSMLVIYGALLVRLTQPLSSWPGRLQICINMFLCLLTSAVTWTVGTILMIDILAQLSMVVMGVLLVAAVMFLGSWVRTAHTQVTDRARMGLLNSLFPRHPFQEPAHGVPAVDICCQWLGCRAVQSAWSENTSPGRNSRQSLLGQTAVAADPSSLLTMSSYFKCMWLHICSRAAGLQTTAILSASPATRAHTLHTTASSGMSSHHYSRSGFPSSNSHTVSSVTHGLVLPSRMSPSPLMRIGGMSFYENTPTEDADSGHQYFCPICMMYYGEVYKTHCCSNYICQECSVVYVSGKRKKAEEEMLASLSLDYDSRRPFMASHIVDCPYCQVSGMVLTRVKPWESVKKYEDELLSSQNSMDVLSETSFRSVGAEKTSKGKRKGKGKGKGKGKRRIEPQLQVAIGDDFDALRRKIDFTGFVDPSPGSDSSIQAEPAGLSHPFPGIAETAELAEPSAVGSSHDHENAMHPVGDESEHFASGSVADVLLPNELDFQPKGVVPSPTSTTSSGSRVHSAHDAGETSCTIPAHINLEEQSSRGHGVPRITGGGSSEQGGQDSMHSTGSCASV